MSKSLFLIKTLVNQGVRIFSLGQVREFAQTQDLQPSYITEALHHLTRQGWITRLKNGLYMVSDSSGFSPTPHDYEIALALVSPSFISHWTALHYHQLTQQIPRTTFLSTPKGTSIPRSIDRSQFCYIQVTRDQFFGFNNVWIEDARIPITDIEKTLLDGLAHPQYCGGFFEVLDAFKVGRKNLNYDKIFSYSLKMNAAVRARLGWVLEHIKYDNVIVEQLLEHLPTRSRKLDATGLLEGPINKKWKIQENL